MIAKSDDSQKVSLGINFGLKTIMNSLVRKGFSEDDGFAKTIGRVFTGTELEGVRIQTNQIRSLRPEYQRSPEIDRREAALATGKPYIPEPPSFYMM